MAAHHKFGAKSEERLATVKPYMQRIARRALQVSRFDFGIPPAGGRRTADEQRELFDCNASKCDGTVRKSKHQSGDAVDFQPYVNGAYSEDLYHIAAVGAAFLQAAGELGYKLEWGGLWLSYGEHGDALHVQGGES